MVENITQCQSSKQLLFRALRLTRARHYSEAGTSTYTVEFSCTNQNCNPSLAARPPLHRRLHRMRKTAASQQHRWLMPRLKKCPRRKNHRLKVVRNAYKLRIYFTVLDKERSTSPIELASMLCMSDKVDFSLIKRPWSLLIEPKHFIELQDAHDPRIVDIACVRLYKRDF